MATATFQFHGDLNFFLPRSRKNTSFIHEFDHLASIKDMIESLNVPHPEIQYILVNGRSVDFNYLVQSGDEIEVYPFFSEVTVVSLIDLRPPRLPESRFVLDTHLGKLASYLRMLGFDTLYSNRYDDDELAIVSGTEDRILLTRDLGVLKRGMVRYGYYIRSTKPEEQLIEVLRRFELTPEIHPFKRCLSCNGLLVDAQKEAVLARLPAESGKHYEHFRYCQQCDKIYWKGSHYERMQTFIQRVLGIEI